MDGNSLILTKNETGVLNKVRTNGYGWLVLHFFKNADHGYRHSRQVWDSCLDIIKYSPKLFKKVEETFTEREALFLLMWASVLHDFSRFLGFAGQEHEAASAELARNLFQAHLYKSLTCQTIWAMLINHDYFNPIIDGGNPPETLYHPLVDIFRLADCTSLSPPDETTRYYETGLRFGTPFFNPELTDENRFDPRFDWNRRDMITWFLPILALRPQDFTHPETQTYYGRWAERKVERVKKRIRELAERYLNDGGRKISTAEMNEIGAIIDRFCAQLAKQS